MTRPVRIRFRNMSPSPELEAEIRSRVSWLESFHPAIVGCQVVLEIPHHHRQHGRALHVRIEVSLPGEDVIVAHQPALDTTTRAISRKGGTEDGGHKDAHVAIHEGFDAARRQLEDVARRQRGDVKTRAATRP